MQSLHMLAILSRAPKNINNIRRVNIFLESWKRLKIYVGDVEYNTLMSRWKADSLEEKLFAACSQRNTTVVAECLKNGANMNKVCSTGRTSLGVAAETGNLDILSLLLRGWERGTASTSTSLNSPNSSNLGYFVVVHSESRENLPEQCEKNINSETFSPKGIDFDEFNDSLIQRFPGLADRECDDVLLTPDDMDNLEWDAEIDSEDELELEKDPWAALYHWYANILSQTGALLAEQPPVDNVDGEDQFGCAALHYAAAEGHISVIQMLMKSGSKVNVEDSDNFTPLHLASAKDRVEVVELLLSHGANPHHRSTDGITALHVCASRGLIDNARALVAAGANVNAVDISDRTPLYLAVSRRQHSVVEFLIEKGAKVNLEEIHGYTPLFEAVCSKDVELVNALLAAGAKVTQSHHLLHYAILHRQEAMVRVLVRAGSIINLRNEGGDTPLMLAVRTQCCSIVRLLLQHGAAVNCVNYVTRQTALHDAISYINRNCHLFGQMFSIFEEFGWDWFTDKEVLCFAITTNNDHAVATLVRRWNIVTDEICVAVEVMTTDDSVKANESSRSIGISTVAVFGGSLPERSEMMNLLLLRDNKFLVELFVYAGFNLGNFGPCNAVTPLSSWLIPLVRNPLSLQNLARIRIRSSLNRNIYLKVQSLPLPPLLKSFLRLEDIMCSCESIER